ncbi:MAG: bifunctional riboflavin kinase/FAD synthetase [Pseudomonadales bacterium]|jgi:riboflavin kinase/FMN adenylyltransferase|nr:bifunctional riboflavin kinase/FAD synthetase [Pseudomonadales bacterium]MDP7146076.1 bifunctional riboflavin kinase/FAD synthetase [Pseudomonadales bacterium]MDP7360131.1 bifunctional riboflavin kinase/FAD synthetase [Pseudomonadales bacterium]MDP7594252.1 bifunctional riboflavin kinase/FAD synthetase [Pseudomonadales bacterium]HJN51818.1 bifunctional riboflavin kinase/FAD synthetase [Pseudomonadales bacterium]|tara:strand:- start:2282 stop:3217 length:936 start_codon:yes stop_codon:yes gene_type:complete
MEVIKGIHNLRPQHRDCIITIGNFDGVHKGHQVIIKHIKEKARELNLPALLICFEPQPEEYFDPLSAPARLTRLREKLVLLDEYGLDRVLCLKFNDRTRNMSARDFVNVLVDDLGVKYLVVGDDWKFGYDRTGDFSMLQQAGVAHGFSVTKRNTLTYDDLRVSSTRIRECLAEGNFDLAEQLLGHPYSIMGKVVYGRQLGKQLGTPTANIQLHRYRAPIDGVYAVEVDGLDKLYFGVANCGFRPTVDSDTPKPILEVHLFDFSCDIYGKGVKVVFRHKIRSEKKFENLEELKSAIKRDIDRAREIFSSAGR